MAPPGRSEHWGMGAISGPPLQLARLATRDLRVGAAWVYLS